MRMTPALRHSPRSMRGATRTITYSNALRADTLGLLLEVCRGGETASQEFEIAGTSLRRRIRFEPRVGYRGDDRTKRIGSQQGPQALARVGNRSSERQENVIPDLGE